MVLVGVAWCERLVACARDRREIPPLRGQCSLRERGKRLAAPVGMTGGCIGGIGNEQQVPHPPGKGGGFGMTWVNVRFDRVGRALLGEEVLELIEVGGGDVGDGAELHSRSVPGNPVKTLL